VDVTPDQPPVPAPIPTVPEIKPSPINAINYLRSWLLLKKLPFKQLYAEFLKLP